MWSCRSSNNPPDWGAAELTQAQHDYAASDVLYLHQLREKFL